MEYVCFVAGTNYCLYTEYSRMYSINVTPDILLTYPTLSQ